MRKVHGAIAVPITVGLLVAVTAGCTSTIAASTNATRSTTAASTGATPTSTNTGTATVAAGTSAAGSGTATSAATTAATTAAPSTQAATRPSSGAASASGTGAPFPGIFDITTWAQYRKVQASVAQGHQPWRLDPEMVVSEWMAGRQWLPAPAEHQVDADTFQMIAPGTSEVYTVHGTRPDPSSDTPVWVITSITHT